MGIGDNSEVTARELNQASGRILDRVEAGEVITVTRDGRAVAILRPYGNQDPAVYAFRTDPMGADPYWQDPPAINMGADFGIDEQESLLREGFGS
ncbi:type II toxin-antitoxin system Phd/YefM family antitoxin [Actinacidiphila oryziradicis]|uniref:Type II toxin-antitoxin system prevent-host-death family antitoxin n=1 Tax=Actinacidiphila oryziradicis TaxID=2571141 RepID=A0A4U0SIT8_9ACTN|nr:type II toxin-antitoxin system prevent-host-death family antitoxin [Actinacidiphila oryziradicis]TKA09654.1 type II toxin-antitoxin system prevent-host-death family antitoxin [Actinacidiphila oryziradicis]